VIDLNFVADTSQKRTHAETMGSFRPRPHVSRYFRIRNFFVPDTATVHMYPANSTANPEKNKYALQCEKKYIRNEYDNVWTGESGYFLIR